jgi:lipoate-protein ligase A
LYYISNFSHDPYYNLAFEEYCFKQLDPMEQYVLLWQNERSVIVGRFQNTLAEINADYVKRHGVHVVRRMTGGGAVYHDLGNLNFTFIQNRQSEQIDFRPFTEPVVKALAEMGITAEISGRNDLTIGGKKFSGNAQYHEKNRTMHHGTLLFAADLDAVEAALQVKQDKYASKGVKSVRSRVTNIREHLERPLTLAQFRDTLLEHLFAYQGEPVREYHLRDEDLAAIARLCNSKYRTWEWNYGQSPQFNVRNNGRFACGGLEVCLQVDKGIIKECKIYGDYFSNEEPTEFEQKMSGVKYESEAVYDALHKAGVARFFGQVSAEELLPLFIPSVYREPLFAYIRNAVASRESIEHNKT